ncbi:hypothetical protein GPECTOR_9g515 [Gonium pectorale]|uniref:Uncharacterized protein n=1 Tax=Gonium pectorale TaxID=33097 RepID=A0A150GRN0_GONPE|nr:hypothetical protein GPECTOR_9g515 [Gonium pectorale]|eukprot:KXZ52471.1 hypothetical protein GPECTOR_9g515 [Gonium pectorale]
MGNTCSVDGLAHMATTEEVRDAVRSIELWQKAQETNKGAGQHDRLGGSILARMGGTDVVKRVVENFYKKLYADEKLLAFLHDHDMTYLRAKQSAFMAWLWGPPQQYIGKHLRTAHLKLIKQRGFSPEDFQLGMRYFEESMLELGAPQASRGLGLWRTAAALDGGPAESAGERDAGRESERTDGSLADEVMAKIRPFEAVIFTPTPKDAEEEARWAVEARTKELAARQHPTKQLSQQDSQHAVTATAITAPPAADAAATAANGVGSRPGSSRVAQCPFTGVAGPTAAAAATAAATAPTAPAAAAALQAGFSAAFPAGAAGCGKPSPVVTVAAGRASAPARISAGVATIIRAGAGASVNLSAGVTASDGKCIGRIGQDAIRLWRPTSANASSKAAAAPAEEVAVAAGEEITAGPAGSQPQPAAGAGNDEAAADGLKTAMVGEDEAGAGAGDRAGEPAAEAESDSDLVDAFMSEVDAEQAKAPV